MKNYDYNDLYKMVISDIPLSDDEVVYGVSFVGPPGIGKSTISKLLSKKLNIYVTANDKIRRLLDNLGIDSSANQQLVMAILHS